MSNHKEEKVYKYTIAFSALKVMFVSCLYIYMNMTWSQVNWGKVVERHYLDGLFQHSKMLAYQNLLS